MGLKGKLELFALVFVGAQLSRLARQCGWSHVHVHSCANSANIGMFASLLSGLPYSLTLHGPWLADYGPNQEEKWRHASFAICVSKKLLAEVKEKLAGHLPPLLDVAPMGVDVRKLHRSAPYQPYNGSGPFVIFSCGRLNPVKGHDDSIRCVAKLREQGINAHLRIAGGDDSGSMSHRRHLEQLIEQYGLKGSVTLLGAVSEDVIRGELERAHVFLLSSRKEGIPVALMEAMAMGQPAVATRVDGVPELIDDGVDGLLVAPKDIDQTVAAIQRILREPTLAMQFSETARRKVERSFHSGVSADAVARNLAAAHLSRAVPATAACAPLAENRAS